MLSLPSRSFCSVGKQRFLLDHELAGFWKGRMELMQSYGTVCCKGLPVFPLKRLSEEGGEHRFVWELWVVCPACSTCVVLSLLICSAFSEQCSASFLCCFSSLPPLPPQSLSIQGEPQGIQWQLNTFLWIDFKALFP